MAKLSNNDSSWRAYGLRKRYADWEPDVPMGSQKAKKKNTNRWCKGKIGIDHVVKSVLVVDLNNRCFKGSDWVTKADGTKSYERIHCGHWRHYTTKCINCGMEEYNLPKTAKAQADPKLAQQLALAEKWCNEGHLTDWQDAPPSPHPYFSNKGWEQKVCVMCGKVFKSRRKIV